MTLLVVTGLLSEARIAVGPGVVTLAGGGGVDLGGRLDELVARLKPAGLLSFGVAGALDPTLQVGDVVAAVEVSGPGDIRRTPWIIPADAAWSATLRAAAGARQGRAAGLGAPATTPAIKASLRDATGATIVDMESAAVALAARERGLPFAVLRVVSDAAGDALPPAALAGMRPDGSTDGLAVAAGLLRRPGDLPALLRTARDYGRAMRRLRAARMAAGDGFAFPPA